MKIVKLKTTLAGGGAITLAHPDAPVGMSKSGDVAIYEVRNVPDEVTLLSVMQIFHSTATVTGYRFNFSELGAGRIVCGAEA